MKFYAALFDFPTVPELTLKIDRQLGPQAYAAQLSEAASQDSLFGACDTFTQQPCSMEGIVTRDSRRFLVADFMQHAFKYVRKNHVKTDIHWKRHWQRAKLAFERQKGEV